MCDIAVFQAELSPDFTSITLTFFMSILISDQTQIFATSNQALCQYLFTSSTLKLFG